MHASPDAMHAKTFGTHAKPDAMHAKPGSSQANPGGSLVPPVASRIKFSFECEGFGVVAVGPWAASASLGRARGDAGPDQGA
jgi:hypothetical protein